MGALPLNARSQRVRASRPHGSERDRSAMLAGGNWRTNPSEERRMAWIIKLTEIGGQSLYVNLDQVASFEPYRWEGGEGARLRTTILDKDGNPVDFAVQES